MSFGNPQLLLIVAAVLGWSHSGWGQAGVPDFAHPATPHVMGKNPFAAPSQLDQLQTVTPRLGQYPLLVVLLEFRDSPHNPDHTPDYFTDLVFGPDPSVSGYYKEVSYGQYGFSNAGVVGWYTVPQPVSMYFGDSQTLYTEVAAVAVQAAAEHGFPFQQFDLNGDGEIRQDELVVLVVVSDHPPTPLPNMMSTRFVHTLDQGVISPAGIEVDTFAVRVDDGLRLVGSPSYNKGVYISYFAHELAHAALGLPDLYNDEFGEDPSAFMTIMATAGLNFQPHIDPWAKIHLGWIKPVVVAQRGWYTLRSVEKSPEALILYDPTRGPDEYFILENRWPRDSFYETAGGEAYFLDQGLAIWHITEHYDDQPFNFLKGRKMIGMKWANGANSVPNSPLSQLWDGAETMTDHDFTDDSVPRNARWADGARSGFRVVNIPDAGPEMEIYIDMPERAAVAPVINPGGIILANLAPKIATISPLSIISVFGAGFTTEQIFFPNLNGNGDIERILGGACLEMSGERLPLYAVTPTQINAQASGAQVFGPVSFTAISNCDTPAALSSEPFRNAGSPAGELASEGEMVTVELATPAFFLYPPILESGIIAARFNSDNVAVAPAGMLTDQFGTSRPAQPGDIIVLYGTGWGDTEARLGTGQLATGAAQVLPGANPTVTFGGVVMDAADIFYVGVTPQAAGLYQLALKVPANTQAGKNQVVLTVYGKSTPVGPVVPVVSP